MNTGTPSVSKDITSQNSPAVRQPSVDTIVTEIGKVKPWVRPVVNEIANRFGPLYFVYGYSPTGSGEHPKGRALDFSVLEYGNGEKDPGPARTKLGISISNYIWENRERLNVYYIIWNRRIISTNPTGYAYNKWVFYPESASQPHTDHVHVSFNVDGSYTPPDDGMEIDDRVTLGEWAKDVLNQEDLSVGALLQYGAIGGWQTRKIIKTLEEIRDILKDMQ